MKNIAACTAFALGLSSVLGTIAKAGDVIYVDDSAIAGANDGTSWGDAFTDLQDALAIAKSGDEIRIGQGTYKPAPPGGDRTISFNLVSGVVMQGGYMGVGGAANVLDPIKFPAILSGDINSTPHLPNGCNQESHHVIRAVDVAAGTELRGCIVQRGCTLAIADFEDQIGGGLRIDGDSVLQIADCSFRDNWSRWGGGVHLSSDSAAYFERCRFINNRLPLGSSVYGGGARALGHATFVDCLFLSNHGAYGGAISASNDVDLIRCQFLNNFGEAGGAVSGGRLIQECLFRDNWGHFGGAINESGAIVNCRFENNYAAFSGGAARNFDLAVNCMFTGNSVEGPGGAVMARNSTLINCSLIGNRLSEPFASYSGTAVAAINTSVTLLNCVIWDNSHQQTGTDAPAIWLNNSTITIQNCLVQGWTGSLGGTDNHGNNPRFVDADGPDNIYGTADDDVRLRPNSPCIDSGNSALLPPDEFDIDEDGDVTEPLPIDLDGLPRVVGSSLDAGAFGFQGQPCRADISGNGSVDVTDLLAVILNWGACTPGETCNSDLDLSGSVNVSDLLQVIASWGACP